MHINQGAFRRNINSCNPPVISGALVGSRTAIARGITSHGNAPALALCRKLLAAGHDPHARLELYRRNNTLALTVRSIAEGARLVARFQSIGEGSRHAAPPVRENRPGLGGGWADWPKATGRDVP